MRTKCDYCGYYIDDTDPYCGNCGAPNDHLMRSAEGVPKTIEELQSFCAAHRLPLDKMRFFIGIDYKEPKAFGIYKDENGNFVVYKNKADGTRAIRYRGSDEAYAVNEIYQKMKSEIQLRKNGENNTSSNNRRRKKNHLSLPAALIIALLPIIIAFIIAAAYKATQPSRGYYSYDDTYYYYQNSSWYYYDEDANNWDHADYIDDELSDNFKDYFEGKNYDSDYGTGDFEDTDYYYVAQDNDDDDNWNDDWDDDDWDWDGGDWDTGATDWDTDWVKLFDIYDNLREQANSNT